MPLATNELNCFVFVLFLIPKLHSAATSVAADLIRYHSDHLVLKALKISGAEGNIDAVAEHSSKLSEQKEQLIEVSWCHL